MEDWSTKQTIEIRMLFVLRAFFAVETPLLHFSTTPTKIRILHRFHQAPKGMNHI